MATSLPALTEQSLPVLLRHAHNAFGTRMRAALDDAGYGDVPENGLYVLGGLARIKGARPLQQLIAELAMSKQSAGQLVDTLVTRGYLQRETDAEDRRRLTVALTTRGRAAARTTGVARDALEAALMERVGERAITQTRRVLVALIELERSRNEQE